MNFQHLKSYSIYKKVLKPQSLHGMGGFTLLEMAMVLAIIGLIMGTILSMTKTLSSSAKISATQSKEALIKAALINFIAVNNRLPCPADPGNSTGLEAVNAAVPKRCTTSATLVATASTTVPPAPSNSIFIGLVPWATLGLTQDGATDGYNQLFTYKVAAIAIQTVPVAALTAVPLANLGQVPTISGLEGAISIYTSSAFTIQTNNCTPAGFTYNPCAAVAVIISYGSDGYGAYTSSGAQNAVPAGYADELVNAGTTTNQIVMHDFSMSTTNPFDDIILPMTSSDLLSPLSANGTIQPYNAVLNNDFANITSAITASIMATRVQGLLPPPSTFALTSGNAVLLTLPQSVSYDPWGHQIQFAFNIGAPGPSPITTAQGTAFNCSGTNPPLAIPQSNILFSLHSYGPDNIPNNADDIFAFITLSQLVQNLLPQC
jgi:prepilin-type N-terminal cleavage/methylation domain-containing protein